MVRTNFEWPEDNLQELTWHRNPNHGITKEKKGPFPRKTLTRMVTAGTLTKQRIFPLENTKGEQASCHLGPSLPKGREAGMWQPEPEGKGLLQSWPQKLHLPPNCEHAASSEPYLPRILGGSYMKQCHSLRSALQRRYTAHLGLCLCDTPRKPSGWDQGCASDTRPTWDGALTTKSLSGLNLGREQNTQPIWQSTWEPEQSRPGKCTKRRAHLGHCPCKAPWSLSRVNRGSTSCLGLWQIKCCPSTARTPHTCQWYWFTVSLPLHWTTEQVSLNKGLPSPPCVRVEIRHWRDLQTEEAKINKEGGTTLEMTSGTD